MLKPYYPYLHSKQTGFSIVEIMVGLAIGMLATIVIMQVFSQFETQNERVPAHQTPKLMAALHCLHLAVNYNKQVIR